MDYIHSLLVLLVLVLLSMTLVNADDSATSSTEYENNNDDYSDGLFKNVTSTWAIEEGDWRRLESDGDSQSDA